MPDPESERRTTVAPLSAQEMHCWRSYIETSLRLHTQLEEDLRAESGLAMSDYQVLVELSEAPRHRLRMGELATRLLFSPSRLTYQIASMEKRGLVLRESCPADRRGSEAVLTATGLVTLRAAAPHHLRSVRAHFVDGLAPDERACLARVFDRLGARLRDSSAYPGTAAAGATAARPDTTPTDAATRPADNTPAR